MNGQKEQKNNQKKVNLFQYNTKKTLFIVLSILISQLDIFATMQKPDVLLWNGDTLFLNKSPLEELPEVCEKILEQEEFISSGCWNGFIAEWIIENDTLCLKNIYSYSTRKKINHRLEKILGTKFENGRIRADWFSESIIGGFGRYLNCSYFLVYENERLMKFEKGKLDKVKELNSENIDYSIDSKKVEEFVYMNFDWEMFDIDKDFFNSATVYVQADTLGKIKKIQFEYCSEKVIEKEIKRILMLIPNWGRYYWLGSPYEFAESYYFEFNNEQMYKYAR